MSRVFVEMCPNPADWFENRLKFSRSVAVNAMVGYVVGLGDRHSYNILIDTTTQELIPIDLGMCFEQGKLLSVPEKVPFRLTRDIVDGMGIGGLDGVFVRCCNATQHVLRSNRELLTAIMEVSFVAGCPLPSPRCSRLLGVATGFHPRSTVPMVTESVGHPREQLVPFGQECAAHCWCDS